MKKSVLVINDNLAVCRQIKYNLQGGSTAVYYAKSVEEDHRQFMSYGYTLVDMYIAFSEADSCKVLPFHS